MTRSYVASIEVLLLASAAAKEGASLGELLV